jgi:hypothetical protein
MQEKTPFTGVNMRVLCGHITVLRAMALQKALNLLHDWRHELGLICRNPHTSANGKGHLQSIAVEMLRMLAR